MKTLKITDSQTTENFTFYDTQRSNGAILRTVDGFEYPSVRASIEDVAGRKSSVYVNSKFGNRVLTITAYLFGTDAVSCFLRRRQLMEVIRQEGYMKLIEFTTLDNIALRFEAEITKLVAPYSKVNKPIMLDLIAPDWRFYSQTESTDTMLPGGVTVISNGGTEKTDPVLEITGPANSIQVSNLTTGESFTLSENLTAGQVLTINMKEQTVVLGSSTNKFSIFSGDFFVLEPGNNSIEFLATSTTGATKIDVIYRDAYLGV